MFKKHYFSLIIFLFIGCQFLSYNNQNKINKNLITCFDSYVNSSKENKVFYRSIGVLENDLIENGMLKDQTKQSYLNMLDSLEKFPENFGKFNNIGKYFQSTNVIEKFHYCVYKEFKQNEKSIYLRNLLENIEKMEMNEFDVKLIKEVIKLLNFENEKLRLIACAYIEMGIFAKFNYAEKAYK